MSLPYFKPLLAEDLSALGIPPEWPYGWANQVRYAELDPLDHANNTAYFRWFEAARIDYMRLWGIFGRRPGQDPRLVIRSTECHFRREMVIGEDFIVTARTRAFRVSSFTMDYAVYAPDLRATGSAVLVLLNPDGNGKTPISEATQKRFVAIDGAVHE